jgi:hypothetical protein
MISHNIAADLVLSYIGWSKAVTDDGIVAFRVTDTDEPDALCELAIWPAAPVVLPARVAMDQILAFEIVQILLVAHGALLAEFKKPNARDYWDGLLDHIEETVDAIC